MDRLTRLAQAAGAGDESALAALVEAAYGDVWRFCTSMLGSQDAEDATQTTFVQAARSLPGFRGASSARTWLLAIARHVCLDELRSRDRRRRRDRMLEVAEEPAAPDPSQEVGVTDLLGRLDPDRRTAFQLTQMLGLSYEEAAEVCACPVGTIRSRVARARADLLAGSAGIGERADRRGTGSS